MIAKINDYGREPIRVTRGIIEKGRVVSFIMADGTKATGKVMSVDEDTAVFIETKEIL